MRIYGCTNQRDLVELPNTHLEKIYNIVLPNSSSNKRIIGYARLSSREQHLEGYSLEAQMMRLINAGCNEIIFDIQSGRQYKERDRKGFQELLRLIELGQVDELVVDRIDRLGRSVLSIRKAIDFLSAKGQKLRSLREQIDTDTASGKLMLNMHASLAEYYSDALSEAVKNGHRGMRERNSAYFPIFGYKVENQKYVPDYTEVLCLIDGRQTLTKVDIAKDLIKTYLEFRSFRAARIAIAKKYGINHIPDTACGRGSNQQGRVKMPITSAGFSSWLNNPILRGHTCYGRSGKQRTRHSSKWDIRVNTHEGIMSESEYQEVSQLLQWNVDHHVRHNGKTKPIHPLSGLIKCAECGGTHRVYYTMGREKVYMYGCSNYANYRSCTQKQVIQYRLVEPLVLKILSERAVNLAQLANTVNPVPEIPKLRELRSQLLGLENLGNNPALEAAKRDLQRQIELIQFEQKSNELNAKSVHSLTAEVFANPLYWSTLDQQNKQDIFRALIKEILVRGQYVLGVTLRDGHAVQFPDLKVPKELKGHKIVVGTKVIVCSRWGDRKEGEVTQITYRSNTESTKRLTVNCEKETIYFDRRTGREVPPSGKVDRYVVTRWIEIETKDKPSIHCPVCNSDRLRKNGHNHATGRQQFVCKDCSKHFLLKPIDEND
ncbi:site-specific recombinase, DNA invertase Pin [Synechococcus sp. PCC 7502]|uniref:fdxN element excision recombinase XisF n=1 Tax=Synechococcus sp. PCC 7502 TaxID=1173263 RepID=UPI00029FC291|nr:fdxN element excision recombinase XisF [Synechococcus sp. PCC 7502]AFY74743.1 site-specific recombinase, DNA invertase Pin [Synechococcus sp. PCC 7502]